VGNRMQKNGGVASGSVLETSQSPEVDVVEVDLTNAYRTPGLVSLIRKVRYLRPGADSSGKIIVRDDVEFREPDEFSTALITLGQITILENGVVEFEVNDTKVYAQINTGGVPIAFTENPVTGFTTQESRGIKRLGIYLAEPVQKGFIEVTITSERP
ncbi:MAG: hypothetical protein ACQKBT_00465, partial [Puniceicoccales bacterium]